MLFGRARSTLRLGLRPQETPIVCCRYRIRRGLLDYHAMALNSRCDGRSGCCGRFAAVKLTESTRPRCQKRRRSSNVSGVGLSPTVQLALMDVPALCAGWGARLVDRPGIVIMFGWRGQRRASVARTAITRSNWWPRPILRKSQVLVPLLLEPHYSCPPQEKGKLFNFGLPYLVAFAWLAAFHPWGTSGVVLGTTPDPLPIRFRSKTFFDARPLVDVL